MEKTSFHGSKIGIPLFFVLVLSLCSAFGTYKLKKTTEIRLWEKNLAAYDAKLDSENKAAINNMQEAR